MKVEVPLVGQMLEGADELLEPGEAAAIVEHLICTRPAQVGCSLQPKRFYNSSANVTCYRYIFCSRVLRSRIRSDPHIVAWIRNNTIQIGILPPLVCSENWWPKVKEKHQTLVPVHHGFIKICIQKKI